MYSQWYCAYLIAQRSLAMIKSYTDGKSKMERFDVDLDRLVERALARAETYKNLLMKELGIYDPNEGVGRFSFFGVSSPSHVPAGEEG